MKKRILSLLLALVMVLGMFPMSAMATGDAATEITAPTPEETYMTSVWISTVEISGVTAQSIGEWEIGSQSFALDIVLAEDTSPESEISLNITFVGKMPQVVKNMKVFCNGGDGEKIGPDLSWSGTVQLNGGAASAVFAVGDNPEFSYTLNFSTSGANQVPILTGGNSNSADLKIGQSYTLDVIKLFEDRDGDELSYFVNDEEITDAANYSYTPDSAGTKILVFKANDGKADSEAYTVTLNVTRNTVPAPSDTTGETVMLDQYRVGTLDLGEVFSDADEDALTYYVQIGDGEMQALSGSVYTYDTSTAGEFALKFYAKDVIDISAAYPVTLTVNAVERHVITTQDSGKNEIIGGTVVEIYIDYQEVANSHYSKYDDNTRTVAVQLDEAVADNAELEINYKDNQVSYGIELTPGTTIQLSDGKAEAVLKTKGNFFYRTEHTYNFYFSKHANTLPSLKSGVNATASANMLAGETYTLNLADVFTDDSILRYKVKIDSADAEALNSAEYSLTLSEIGTYQLLFTAQDIWGETVTHTVTLTVSNATETYDVMVNVPEDIAPAFYPTTGYNADSEDLFEIGSALTTVAGEAANGYVPYTVKVPANISTISFRDATWGGMSIPVSEDAVFTLEKFSGKIDYKINGSYVTAQQALFRVKDNYGSYAVPGGSDVDGSGMIGYRFLLAATGNDAVYTLSTLGLGDQAGAYSENIVSSFALEPGGETEKVLEMTVAGALKITVPAGAELNLFRQQNNYNTKEVAPVNTETANGITTYMFNHPGTNVTWRASMEGKITKAGYIGNTQSELDIAWDHSDPATDTLVSNSVDSELAQRHDASAVLNVNSQNHLVLNEGDNFRLRAYRWWQIINSDAANIMIEPDFHYSIVTGSNVISIDAKDGGNASGNWMDITANSTGTAVVEVAFDAINVSGSSYIDNFTFGACEEERTALVVISVGEETAEVDFGIEHNTGKFSAWDAEFSTLYFLDDEESGNLVLKPKTSGTLSISHDKGQSWTPLTGTDGTYTASVVPGNNILKIETEGGVDYQVVRGAQVTVSVQEQTGDGDDIIEAGETVRVMIDGLHHNISKMSGIYNPGYGGGVNVYYTAMDGDAKIDDIRVNHGQYRIATSVSFAIPDNAQDGAEYTLTNGYLDVTGPGAGAGAHRDIGDAGVGTSTSASNSGYLHGNLPDITIKVGVEGMKNRAPVARDSVVTEVTIEAGKNYAINPETLFTDPDGDALTYTVSVNGGAAEAAATNYKYTPAVAGTYTLLFTATDPDGKSATHTITLTATASGGGTTEPDEGLKFDISGSEIDGYVTVSFEDNAIRVSGETGLRYPVPLGTIIAPTRVPFKNGDSIADVTVRLLDAMGIGYSYTGSVNSNFYLAAIKNFEVGNTPYDELGEFHAGSGSGWMITWDGWFINKGTSEFAVEDGDEVRWQYTCQLGIDIGDDYGAVSGGDTTTAADRAAAREVKALIEAIGTVTKDSGDAIEAAREAYDALTDAQKDLVPNYDDLLAAEKKYAQLTGEIVFTDVDKNAYYYEAVKWAVEMGITKGTDDTTFSPYANCTRAQMVTFLWRAAGEPKATSTTCIFTDVDKNAYYYEALLWAVENGITSGTSATTFSPDADCSRGQMAAFLYRSAKTPVVSGNHAFTDVKADAYYNDAVIWAAARDITKGTGATTFSPSANCTRGQMVTFLYRYLAK